MSPRAAIKRKDLRPFVDLAVEMGAEDALVIAADTITCEPWVRLKCQFGCGGYNKRLTCPPYTPTPEETAKVVACYCRAILLHAFDDQVIDYAVPRLERSIFLAGYYKSLGFGSGPCRLCRTCNTRARCKLPDLARPSMEACGIDVFHTARANGFDIRAVTSRRQRGDYFGVVLVD